MKEESLVITDDCALIVVDVKEGFDDESLMGKRNNPEADRNIEAIINV